MNNLSKKRILVVLAHPDDESYGMGGTMAKYSHYGAQVVLLCATRGEAGILGVEPEDAWKIREKELMKAAEFLGVQVFFLGYHDGELSSTKQHLLIEKIAGWIYAVEPDLILTFGPDGVSGHPDHIAISMAVTQAVNQFFPDSNLLYLAPTEATLLGCGVSAAQTDSSEPLIAIDINGFKINKVKAIQSHFSQHPELTGKLEKEVEKIPCYEYFSVARNKGKMESSLDWFLSIAETTHK